MDHIIIGQPGDDKALANDINMAKQAFEVLARHYPGWLWGVNVDSRTGMCDVKNFNLSGNRGFRMKLGDIYSASSFEADIMKAGGEILERYGQGRTKFNAQAWAELTLNAQGVPIGDYS